MTTRLIQDFFPSAKQFLEAYLPEFWEYLQPSHLLIDCPERVLSIPISIPSWLRQRVIEDYYDTHFHEPDVEDDDFVEILKLRNPNVVVLQLIGVIIGLIGYWRLSIASRRPSSQRQNAQAYYLAYSFWFFAWMNLSSFMANVLLARHTVVWQVFKVLDVTLTGCSAICLIFSTISSHGNIFISASQLFIATFAYGTLGNLYDWPWTNEVLYILTMVVSCIGLLKTLPSQLRSFVQYTFFAVFVLGIIFILVSVPSDQYLCEGYEVGSLELLFVGSDTVFVALCGIFWNLNTTTIVKWKMKTNRKKVVDKAKKTD